MADLMEQHVCFRPWKTALGMHEILKTAHYDKAVGRK
jgi:hypothetical protein